MSPSCMATIFEGDNGGATSTGVSGTEIRVAVPLDSGFVGSGSRAQVLKSTIDAFFAHFNQRFEFYGRKMVPVYVTGGSTTPTANRAHAAEVIAQNVFGAFTGVHEWYYEVNLTFTQTLARGGVITVTRAASSWLSDRTLYDDLHPYAWSVYQSSEDFQRTIGDFACRSLAGQKARFAGDAALKGATRKFGIVAATIQAPQTTILANALTACTGEAPMVLPWSTSDSSTVLRTGFTKLRDEGATTLICVCDGYGYGSATGAPKGINYSPEWILTPTDWFTGLDEYQVQDFRRNNVMAPPIRISGGERILPLQSRPWYGALVSTGLSSYTGDNLYTGLGMAEFIYPELLLLATGIQGAGPDLTPDSFAQALMSTQFPNPGAGAAPFYQPSAGFGPGDHSLYDDYNVGWWSDTAEALDYPVTSRPQGSWCYLGQAKRYQVGQYPIGDDQLFNSSLPCR